MEQLTRGDVEFSYGLPLTVKQVYRVKKVGGYPMNRVQQIHNKSGQNTQNYNRICNIALPKIFIRVINQRVDRKQIYPPQNSLPPSTVLHTPPIETFT